MTAFVACGGLRPRWLSVAFVLAFVLLAIAVPRPARADSVPERTASFGAEPITVRLDQAMLLKVPDRTATLVIGNPLIADVAVQPGGIMVVTAKSYGITNVMALDRGGKTLMEHPIQVVGPVDSVVLYRGIERESYSCLPTCERRIVLGDSVNYFNANLTQGTILNAQAQGSSPK
jgi:putative type II/III system pilus formation protein